ncbi:MAG: NAD(P)H-dependent oxidoreductase subunit E [Phycisphaerae bacterium]|nr:NAD(P)H-dependent oxidoreductase subunit E [Phycisphaerae bacterium]
MAWIAEDRRAAKIVEGQPLVTEEMKSHLRDNYFPRFPTKRAVLLPALHLVQHTYNWIPSQAIQELAEFLEISPAEALDTATFYEEYWLRPKGKYLIQVCRSLSCEICDSQKLTDHISRKFNIEHGETTPDGRFTLVELECLGSCGTAPAALINEVLLEDLTVEKLDAAVNALPDDPHDYRDPTINWDDGSHGGGH